MVCLVLNFGNFWIVWEFGELLSLRDGVFSLGCFYNFGNFWNFWNWEMLCLVLDFFWIFWNWEMLLSCGRSSIF